MDNKYTNQSTDSRDAFVTGATGLIGRWLVPELTRRGSRVFALVRNAEGRRAELQSWIDAHGGDPSRVEFLEGDVDRPQLGLDESGLAKLQQVHHVFHLAVNFAWHLERDAAHQTNVAGTRRVLELAASLPALEHMILTGGYRAGERITPAGTRYRAGSADFARAGTYASTKFESLHVARTCAQELGVPLSILHPSSVIGDSKSGETTQLIGLGEMVVSLARGQLPARSGSARTYVPLVTVDMVARVLAEMAGDRTLFGRELTLLDPRTPELDRLIDRTAQLLGVRAPRLRLPLWLVRALPEWITRTPRETLAFLDDARYSTEDTDAWLASRGLAHPEIGPAFDRWVHAIARAHVPELQLTAVSGGTGSAIQPV